LLRLAAEQRKESAALASHLTALCRETIELGLLALRVIFVALDLLGTLRIGLDAAIDLRELSLQPHANRITLLLLRSRRWQRRLRIRCCRTSGNRKCSRDRPAQ
jgi:hypothetical protein